MAPATDNRSGEVIVCVDGVSICPDFWREPAKIGTVELTWFYHEGASVGWRAPGLRRYGCR